MHSGGLCLTPFLLRSFSFQWMRIYSKRTKVKACYYGDEHYHRVAVPVKWVLVIAHLIGRLHWQSV